MKPLFSLVRAVALLALIALSPSATAQNRLDRALQRAVEDGVIIGAQAYVGQGDEALLDEVYGRVRPDREAKVDAETLFCIGSVSKPLVSAMALGLAHEGKLDLVAPISRYLAAFEHLSPAPTAAQLLAHRGGIYTQRRKLTQSQLRWIRDFRLSLAEAVEGIAGEELIAKPGELYAYSGAGYCVLGRALEAAGQADLDALLQARLGEPLGWRRTSYFPSPRDRNVAAGADAAGQAHPATPHLLGTELRFALAGGSVYSTARELARFARSMAQGGAGLLAPEAFAQVVRRPFRGQPYGYGWSLVLVEGSDSAVGLRHNGALAASRASLVINLESGRYDVVLYSVAGPAEEAEKHVRGAMGSP